MKRIRKIDNIRQNIDRISSTFVCDDGRCEIRTFLARTVKSARLYRVGYCQTATELSADYSRYVYENSFARRRRRR